VIKRANLEETSIFSFWFATDLILPLALNIQYGTMGQGRWTAGLMIGEWVIES
jgi:hypothetical protein